MAHDSDFHFNQIEHNKSLLEYLDQEFPDDFFDWKITILFYNAVHYWGALACFCNINVGSHEERAESFDPNRNATYPAPGVSWKTYGKLKRIRRDCSYNGFLSKDAYMKQLGKEYGICKSYLESLKKDIENEIEKIKKRSTE